MSAPHSAVHLNTSHDQVGISMLILCAVSDLGCTDVDFFLNQLCISMHHMTRFGISMLIL